MQKFLKSTIAALAVLYAAGCGGGAGDTPKLGYVTGVVTFEDQPLAGASVVFQPENGRPAIGKTDAEGKYELVYIRDTKGCKTGFNSVRITMADEEDEEGNEDSPADDAAPQSRPTKVTPEAIPVRYNTRTELTAEVIPGPNTFNFDLKK